MTSPISISENSYHSRSFDQVLRLSSTTSRSLFRISLCSYMARSSFVYGFIMIQASSIYHSGISHSGSTDTGNSQSFSDRQKYFLCTDSGKDRGSLLHFIHSSASTSLISHSRISNIFGIYISSMAAASRILSFSL